MAKSPWEYADATGNEHAHQVALFSWANMAAKFGILWANEPANWTKEALKATWGKTAEDMGLTPQPKLLRLHAIHNQGHGDSIRGARAKAEGVKPGVPDIFLPVRIRNFKVPLGTAMPTLSCGLYIELKRPDSVGKRSGVTHGEQDEWIEYLKGAGYYVSICYGWLEARDAIVAYLDRKKSLGPD